MEQVNDSSDRFSVEMVINWMDALQLLSIRMNFVCR